MEKFQQKEVAVTLKCGAMQCARMRSECASRSKLWQRLGIWSVPKGSALLHTALVCMARRRGGVHSGTVALPGVVVGDCCTRSLSGTEGEEEEFLRRLKRGGVRSTWWVPRMNW